MSLVSQFIIIVEGNSCVKSCGSICNQFFRGRAGCFILKAAEMLGIINPRCFAAARLSQYITKELP